jgi:hypothetical protein
MTCQDIVHNLYNFYIDNKYHRFLRDNCHEYCTIVGWFLFTVIQQYKSWMRNRTCNFETVSKRQTFIWHHFSFWLDDRMYYANYIFIGWLSLNYIGFWIWYTVQRRAKSRLYISYKTTFCQNIIPKSINVRFWWNFYQPKRKRMYFLYCFKILFDAQILNIHNLNTNLNYLSSKLLSLHSVFDVQYSVLCITRELLKFLAYRIMLKLQWKFTFNFAICW